MERRQWLKRMLSVAVAPVSVPGIRGLIPAASRRSDPAPSPQPSPPPGEREAEGLSQARPTEKNEKFAQLEKSKAEWRQLLAPAAYAVLFEEDTEAPFTSPLDKEKRQGTYVCAACYRPLFSSKTKFDSRTGWPSFYEPIQGRLGTKRDYWLIVPRIEYHCIRCGGHQGHVFNDGPPPTGQRWCNNGVALRFVPEAEPLPALRT